MELKKLLESEGYTDIKEINGRGLCGLYRFIFTTGLVTGLDSTGYSGRYCYSSKADALKALESWDGQEDPSGDWIKYKGKGGERPRIWQYQEEHQQKEDQEDQQ